jgi:tetratricopeptide (TPR) repeat protein
MRFSQLVFAQILLFGLTSSLAAPQPPWLSSYLETVNACRDAYERGDLNAIRASCQQAIDLVQHRGADQLISVPLNLMGLAEENLGSPERAIGLFSEVIKLLQEARPPDPVALARVKDNLGLAYVMTGQSRQALSIFDEDIQVFLENKEARDVATTTANRAIALADLGQKDDALSAARDAVVATDQAFGPQSLEAARSRVNIAELLGEIGRADEAIDVLKAAENIIETVYPPAQYPDGTRDLAYAERSMGMLLEDHDRHEDAIVHLQNAARIMTKLAPDGIDLGAIQNNLGIALENNRRLKEALSAYRKALELLEANAASAHEIAVVQDHLGRIVTELGNCDEGRALGERAVKAFDRLLGPLAEDTAIAHANLAQNRFVCGGPEAALDEYRQATSALSASIGLMASAVSSTPLREQQRLRNIYSEHLHVLAELVQSRSSGATSSEIEEAVKLAQLAEMTSTGIAIAQRAGETGADAQSLNEFY